MQRDKNVSVAMASGTIGVALALMLLGCNAGESIPGAQLPATDVVEPGSQTPATSAPVFPTGEGEVYSPVHEVSEAEQSVLGKDYVSVSPGNTYVEGNSVSLVSVGSEAAWAMYSVAGLTTNRPVKLGLDVEATTTLPGGAGEHLSIEYWVGVANYSAYNWEWQGPYTSADEITLHNEETRSRFVSRNYGLHFAVVCHSTSEDSRGVKINASTITTLDIEDGLFLHTLPHAALPTGFTTNPEARQTTLNWEHIPDVHAPSSSPGIYKVVRRLNATDQEEVIGSVVAPGTTYTEPNDILPGVLWPVDGLEARYFVVAQGPVGPAPKMYIGTVQHGLGQPLDLFATQGSNPDGVDLTWDYNIGAEGYIVYRDGMSEEQIIAEIPPGESYFDSTASKYENHTYYIRATGLDTTSVFSDPATGYWNGVMVTTWGIDDPLSAASHDQSVDGAIYLCGYKSPKSYLVKFNQFGEFQTATSWSGIPFSVAKNLVCDPNGNVWVTFFAFVTNQMEDACLAKFSPDLDAVSSVSWGGDMIERAGSIVATQDGSIIVTGVSESFPFMDGWTNVFLCKYSKESLLLWDESVSKESSFGSSANDLDIDGDGNIYYCGSHTRLVKLDSSGNLLFQKQLAGDNSPQLLALEIQSNGNIYVIGSGLEIFKFDPAGELVWNSALDGGGLEAEFLDIATNDAGWSYVVGNQGDDLLLLEYDPDGNLSSQHTWASISPGSNVGNTISFANDGRLIISGSSNNLNGYWSTAPGSPVVQEVTVHTSSYQVFDVEGVTGTPEFEYTVHDGTVDGNTDSSMLLMLVPIEFLHQ